MIRWIVGLVVICSLVGGSILFVWNAERAEVRAAVEAYGARFSPNELEVVHMRAHDGVYYVEAYVLHMSTEATGIGEESSVALKRPVLLQVAKRESEWQVRSITPGAHPSDGEWIYSEEDTAGLRWHYPKVLPSAYITPSAWPPSLTVEQGSFSCKEGDSVFVEDREYCVVQRKSRENSQSVSYEYQTLFGGQVVKVGFSFIFPPCEAFSEPERYVCAFEQDYFDIDGLVDRIVSSLQIL